SAAGNSSRAPPARAADQESNQYLFVIVLQSDTVIVNAGFQHHAPQALQITGDRFVIALGNLTGFGEDRRPPLHIEEPHRPVELEGQLLGIKQMKDGGIVLAEAQVLKTVTQFLRLDEQVGDDDNERSLRDRFGKLVKNWHKLRRADRLRLLEDVT